MAKKIEALAPEQFSALLEERNSTLERLIKAKETSINKAPAGAIRIVQKNHAFQFYLKIRKGDCIGKYLPKKQNLLAMQIIQKEYDIKLLRSLKLEAKIIQKLCKNQKRNSPEQVYFKLNEKRKLFTQPVTLPDEQYATKWNAVEYCKKPFYQDSPEFYTSKGERVRSKSEILIADALTRNKIPYHYEFPLQLKTKNSNIEIHPDFICLNLKKRREFIWEHFGMMDSPEYAENFVKKQALYQENGFFAGKNLLCTFETSEHPINLKQVELVIQNYLT